MGEIKSTLDIVMEKTKHLSLSKEEKATRKTEEIQKTIKGMIQKFKDQLLREDRFGKELEALEKTHNLHNRIILKTEIFDQIDLNRDNTPLLVLLRDICGENVSRIESLLRDYARQITAASDKRIVQIKDALSEKYSLSGSAVVPNLENDSGWVEEAQKIKETYEKSLDQEKASMMDG